MLLLPRADPGGGPGHGPPILPNITFFADFRRFKKKTLFCSLPYLIDPPIVGLDPPLVYPSTDPNQPLSETAQVGVSCAKQLRLIAPSFYLETFRVSGA